MTDPQDIDVCAHCGTPINCDESCQRGQAQLLKQYEEAILKARDDEDARMAEDLKPEGIEKPLAVELMDEIFASFTNMQHKGQKELRKEG